MAARPVDAEKYMELLKEQYLHHEAMGNKQVAKAWQGAMQLLYDMPTLTPPNEWVSVEERLPEGHVQVLMWSAKWNIAEAGSYYNKHFWVYSEIGDGYIAEDITYWMPLPAPPDKGNNVLAKTPNEPLTLEHLRASPHGKIKDSTLQSICNRANEIACRPPEGEANA